MEKLLVNLKDNNKHKSLDTGYLVANKDEFIKVLGYLEQNPVTIQAKMYGGSGKPKKQSKKSKKKSSKKKSNKSNKGKKRTKRKEKKKDEKKQQEKNDIVKLFHTYIYLNELDHLLRVFQSLL